MERLSDEAFLEVEGVKPFMPTAAEMEQVIAKLAFEPATSAAHNEVLDDYATGPADPERQGNFFFVSLQSLVPIFRQCGYDIRHYMSGDPCGVLAALETALQRRTQIPMPKIAGEATVEGINGLILPEHWLRSAGLDPTANLPWQQRTGGDDRSTVHAR